MADTNLLVLAREYKKLREEVKKVLSMPKGDKGDQGEKGEKGDKGDTGPQGFPGRDGKDGINGYDGKDGRDGIDGKDGKDGLDGVGVKNAYIDFDNSLVIVLTSGQEINAGFLSQETKDAVVATFKQGAQTLNELLPSQEGNSGKYLTTDGSNVSWAIVAVDSVNGQTGVVVLDAADVGAATTAQGALADTAVQPGSLATVATTGAYADLYGKPTLGTAAAANSTDFATAAQGAKADSALQPADIGTTVQGYNAGTVVDASYVHTDNNYTTAEKNKLAGIEAGAEVNVNADWNAVSGDAQILNKPTAVSAFTNDTGYLTSYTETDPVVGAVNGLVKANGAGTISAAVAGTDYLAPSAIANMLETSDIGVTVQGYSTILAGTTASFTTADEAKLDGIEAGADVTDAANVEPLVNSHLNTSTAASGEVLSWNGTDYDWITPPAGYSDSSVDAHLNTSTATSGQVLGWTGTDYDWVDQSGSGGGGTPPKAKLDTWMIGAM